MTDQQFDDLAKRFNSVASRRGVLKGALAVAVGGLVARFRGADSADAAARQACMRLHQTCDATHACCTHLACENGDCCRPVNETCYAADDCCPGAVCAKNPHGMGMRCLALAGVGEACVSDSQCASGFCDPYTLTCDPACVAVCAAGDDSCAPGAPHTCCGSHHECICASDIEGNPVCGSPIGFCAPCQSNADCQLEFAYEFPFADQLVCLDTPGDGNCCGGYFSTACVLPCDVFESTSVESVQAASAFGGYYHGLGGR